MFRRISALLLCIVMLAGMMPVSAFAQESAESESVEIVTQPQETSAPAVPTDEVTPTAAPVQSESAATDAGSTVPVSTETVQTEPMVTEAAPTESVIRDDSLASVSDGTGGACGFKVTWTYAEGTLTISGTGPMYSYSSTTLPWLDYTESITRVVLEHGITEIGNYAFYGCINLTDISIPDSITYIGPDAFHNCSSLTEITIPSGVTAIHNFTFQNCTNLQEITIPAGITSIGGFAFQNCSSLKEIELPAGVTTIGNYAFDDCTGLTNITVPKSVTSIGDSAFGNCSKLKHIVIPEGVTAIGSSTFDNCSSLTEIVIPEGVASIGMLAFHNCSGLRTIHIPASVSSIDDGNYVAFSPFYGCNSSMTIYCTAESAPAGWGPYWNYRDTSNYLTTYWGFSKLDLTFWDTLDSSAESIMIPDGVTYIPNLAFQNFTNLKSVYIPASVTDIQIDGAYYESPFLGCSGDLVIYCEASAKPANWSSYWNCNASGTYLPVNYGWSAADYSFWPTLDRFAESVVIPDGVTFVPQNAFADCTRLKSVIMPDSVRTLGSCAFSGCSALTEVTLSRNITSIAYGVFENCTSLTRVTVPAGVTRIDQRAFYFCSALTEVSIPDSVAYIGVEAFCGCGSLKEIAIPYGVTSIGDFTFQYCSSLTTVSIPASVTSIGQKAFQSCSSLKNVTIPESVSSIAHAAFSNCASLTAIAIPEGVSVIDTYTFEYCSALATVSIPASVHLVSTFAFDRCFALTDLYFGHTAADQLSLASHSFYAYNYDNEYFPVTIHVPTSRDINSAIRNYDWDYRTVTYAYTGNIPATAITLTETNSTTAIEAGLDLNFTAALIPCDTTSELVWTASNGGIVKESDYISGTATIIGTETGTMTVRCESADDNSVFAQYQVEILPPTAEVEAITVRPDTDFPNEVEVGTTVQMIADIHPGNAANKEVVWELENGTGTAELDENGLLTALTTGTVTVFATSTDNTEIIGSAAINIVRYVDDLALLFNGDPTQTSIGVGEPVKVTVAHFPEDATNKDIAWTWTDGTGSITSQGSGTDYILICGEAAGTVTLTATAKDSKKTAVTVELEVVGEKASHSDGIVGGNIYYNTVTGAIVDADDTVTAANIPARINGTTITSVAPQAFQHSASWKDNTTLTSVIIPSTVTYIGDGAFRNCTALSSLRLGSGVTTIGEQAFYNCKSLANLTIPESVISVGAYAFYGLESLKNLTIPGSLNTREWLHYGLYESLLNTVTFTGTTIIGQPHFDYGNGASETWHLPGRDAKHVIISDSITSIGDYAFSNRGTIEKVTMSSNITSIGISAFESCDKLTSLDLPASLTSIGKDAFRYCGNLQLLDLSAIPDTITQQDFPLTADLVNIPDVLISASGGKVKLDWFAWEIDGESGQAGVSMKGSTGNYYLGIYETGKVGLSCYDEYTGARGSKIINCELGLEIEGLYWDYLTAGQKVTLTAYRADTGAEESATWSLRPEDKAYASLSRTSGTSTVLTAKSVEKATQIQITATSNVAGEAPEIRTLWILPTVSGITITDAEGNVVGKTGTSVQTIKVDMRKTDTLQFFTATYPEGASGDIWWNSDKTSIAEVNYDYGNDGMINLKGTGTATLKAYTTDGSNKYASVKLQVYYLDTAQKLTAKTTAPAIGLVDSATAQIQVFGTDKNNPLDPAAFTYSVVAGQEEMASVDENGIITAGSKAGTVTITAAVKDDPLGRKVTVNVKIIPAQTASILLIPSADESAEIVMLDANGVLTEDPAQAVRYRVYLNKDHVQDGKYPITLKPVGTDTNGNTMYLTKSSLKWASTDTRVAAVAAGADGNAVVTIQAKTDGACVITATSTDLAKVEGLLEIFVRDYAPRLENATVTVNSNLTAGVSTGLVSSYGNDIRTLALFDPNTGAISSLFAPAYTDATLTVTPKDVLKNGTYKLTIKALCNDYEPFEVPLTVKVANKLPSVAVKQNGKFNLFYTDSTAGLQITVKGETVLDACIDPASTTSFRTVSFDPETSTMMFAFTPEYIAGTAGKLDAKVNVLVYLDGYRNPVSKAVTISTATTKPSVSLTPASSVINTATKGERSTVIRAYNKTAGTYVPIQPEKVTAAFADISAADGGLKLTLTDASGKGGSATILVQDSNWTQPIKLTHKVSVQTKLPAVNLSASTLKLNRVFTEQTAAADITLNQQNMPIAKIEIEAADKNAKLLTESAKIKVEVIGSTVTARLHKENLPANGNYSFRAIVTLEDGTKLAAKTFKVNVSSTVPAVTLKTSTLKLNKVLGSEYAAAWSPFVLTKGDGYEIAGFKLPENWTNSDISVTYSDGMVHAKLLRDEATAKKHTVSLTPILRHIATGEESPLPATVKLTVQVESKAPGVNITAAGKLDANLPDSAITYTVKSFTNVNGTPTAIKLEGTHGDLFEAGLDTSGSSPIVTLTMRDGIKYNLKTTYKVDLVFTICGQQVRKNVSFKISRSNLKFAAVKTVNLYQFQSDAVTTTITVTAPAGAAIEDITLNSKTALQFRRALGNGSMEVTPIGDGSSALVSFTFEHPGYLTYGKSYTVLLDVTPVSTADTVKTTQVKLTVKSCK